MATFTAAVAANEVVTIQVMNSLGQAVVLGVMFVFVSVIGAAVAVDIFSRSNQTVATLRSIGAQRGSISTSILASVLVFACAGSAAGALLGTGLGSLSIFGAIGTPGLMGAILDAVLVLGLTAVASGVGVYIGVRAAWRN